MPDTTNGPLLELRSIVKRAVEDTTIVQRAPAPPAWVHSNPVPSLNDTQEADLDFRLQIRLGSLLVVHSLTIIFLHSLY